MESWLSRITDYLLAQSWQIAVLTVVVAIVSLLLRNRSAHVRYLLWLLVLAKCLVPPLHSVPFAVLPPEHPIAFFESSSIVERTFDASRIERDIVTEQAKSTSVQAPIEPPSKTIEGPITYNIRVWLAIGWLVGAVALLFYNLLNALRTQIWLLRQRKALPVKFRHNVESFFSAHGMKHIPNVWLINGINQPFVWGLVRGSIYLPADLLNFQDPKSWASLLGHELSHVIRFDAMVHTLQIFAQVVFWFHPFVWWANRKIRAEREKCCDEMAIVSLHTLPEDYSEAIVNVLAAKYESIRPVPSLAVAGPVKNIEERIKTMLRPGKKFYKRPSLIAATVVLLIAFLTVPTALILTARAGTKATPIPLQQAAADGDIDKVRSLILKGANVNEIDESGKTSLHLTVRYGYENVAKVLVRRGADVNAKDGNGLTPLHFASRYAWYDTSKNVTELLLSKSADVNAKDSAGQTPLHIAAGWGSKEIIELLITKGADLQIEDKGGLLPLHYAAHCGRKDSVELLLANGSDINARGRKGWTALHAAANHPNWANRSIRDTVELLIAKSANVNAKDDNGRTPLHEAATRGRNLVRLLIASGADVNAKDDNGCTPLHAAASKGRDNVVKILLNRGADVNAKANNGTTALHEAARSGRPELPQHRTERQDSPTESLHRAKAVVEMLVAKGADINASSVDSDTAACFALGVHHLEIVDLLIAKGSAKPPMYSLYMAACKGDLDTVKSFIESEIGVNANGKPDPLILHGAAYAGQKEIVEFLIARGADVNSKDWLGQTALHCAASRGQMDVAKLLIAKGADVNIISRRGIENNATPLHIAAEYGYRDFAEILIGNGANIDAGTGRWTPLQESVYRDRQDVVELLLSKGADANAGMSQGWTPLHNAAYHNGRVVELLIANGADVNAEEAGGWTPLHYAVWINRKEAAVLLLDNGANPNVWDLYGTTPLQYAVKEDDTNMAEVLISKGADVNLKLEGAMTPLQRAKDKGNKEMIELLRKHGAKE